MSFASFVDNLAESIQAGVKTVTESRIIPDTVGKITKAGINVGKIPAKLAFKAGVGTVTAAADFTNFVIDNHEEIIDGAKAIGKGIAREANEIGQAGVGAAGKFIDTFTTPATLDRSIIGRKINKKGLALVAVGATAMQGARDTKEYIDSRQGMNDGQLYSSTPRMGTPYQLSEQMAYSQHGRSFADNAGATGDLVFALNNMRNG